MGVLLGVQALNSYGDTPIPLTDTAIRAIKNPEKQQKHSDALGLYLLAKANGARLWRFKYRIDGKEKLQSIGAYPEVSLKAARLARDETRAKLIKGIDPNAERLALRSAEADNFEAVAREWHTSHMAKRAPSHSIKVMRRLERNIFPWLGSLPTNKITAMHILKCIQRIEERGTVETAHRTMQVCSQVFRYGIRTGRCENDPVPSLRGAIAPAQSSNHPHLTDPKEVGELLRVIDGYHGTSYPTEIALRLLPLVFVRPSELRQAEWSEFDLDNAEWTIPAKRMKVKTNGDHNVPLSKQAIKLLREIQAYSGTGTYVFKGNTGHKWISDGTLNAALRGMGYKDKATAHGFRHTASTLLHELSHREGKWSSEAIERQLAHADTNAIRGTYNKAKLMPERKRMMQFWADYLDVLKTGSNVTPFRRAS